jgi:glyoxylase-like metal-dependent hydrolase (beta-lactamase superfamily II)
MGKITKMYLVESGRIIVPDSDPLSVNNTENFKYSIPVPVILLEHSELGLIVVDAGIELNHFSPSAVHRLIYDESARLDHIIENIGYQAEDVQYLILSHWHRDHHNQLFLFPNATLYIREAELKGLFDSNGKGYGPVEKDAFLRYRQECPCSRIVLLPDQDEVDVLGDGSIVTIDSKGHTPGHQSIKVQLDENETWIFAGDAIHNRYQVLDDKFIENTWDFNHHKASIQRLLKYAGQCANLIYGHDVDQWNELKHWPEYYESK